MKKVNISEVRNHLPSLLDEIALSNEPIVVTRHGKPVAKILPFRRGKSKRQRYPLRGLPIHISKDFDKPAPELWEAIGK
jgi:prevent-host-death family protein